MDYGFLSLADILTIFRYSVRDGYYVLSLVLVLSEQYTHFILSYPLNN